jgi:hypothetical protein
VLTIVLDSQPTADVEIPVFLTDTSEAFVDQSVVTFTSLDWSTEQTVNIVCVDDDVVDGAHTAGLLLGFADSLDSNYNNVISDQSSYDVTAIDGEAAAAVIVVVVVVAVVAVVLLCHCRECCCFRFCWLVMMMLCRLHSIPCT